MFDPELRDHLLIMRRYLPLILGGAALIGFLVWFLQSQANPVYEASSTVHLEVDATDDGLVTDFQAESFVQLIKAPANLEAIAEGAGLGGLDTAVLDSRLSVGQRSIPGFIDLTASGTSPEDAAALANSSADVLNQIVAASREASTGTSSSTIAPATAPSAPVSPKPLRDAVVAALISLIVLAEGSVLFTKIRGRVSLANPDGDVQRVTGVPTFTIDDEDHYNQAIMPLYVNSLAKQPSVVVVQRGEAPSTTVASQVGNAASLVGRNVSLIDGNLSGSQFVAIDPDADFTVVSVTSVSNESEALLAVSRLPHAVVLVCDPASVPMADIEAMARNIPGVGGNLVGIILNEPSGLADKLASAFRKSPEVQVSRPTIQPG